MVRKSTPASALISPTYEIGNEYPMKNSANLRTHVSERSTHDDRLVFMLLVVVEDLFHGLYARIFVTLVVLTSALFVPVEDLPGTLRMECIFDMILLTRPTNGEIKVTPASAQATACPKPKRRVRLQWMPSSRSSSRAA